MHTIDPYTTTTHPTPANMAETVMPDPPYIGDLPVDSVVVAVVLLFLALALLYRALRPFRELIRALMAAGLAGALGFAALVLIVASTAMGV
jgi:hypothetical protein